MRGSLEAGKQTFNIETDTEHVRAWVVSDTGQRIAGAVFESGHPADERTVVGTWSAGDPYALAAFSSADAALYLNHDEWPAGLWCVSVQAGTPQQAIHLAVEEARARLHPPRLAAADDAERWPASA